MQRGNGVAAKARRGEHADELVQHLPRAIRLQRLGQGGANVVGIAGVGDDQVPALRQAVGATRVRGRG